MIGHVERGWAWSRALLGIPAKEVHLCGEAAAINIVKKVLENTNDTFEVNRVGVIFVLSFSYAAGEVFYKAPGIFLCQLQIII